MGFNFSDAGEVIAVPDDLRQEFEEREGLTVVLRDPSEYTQAPEPTTAEESSGEGAEDSAPKPAAAAPPPPPRVPEPEPPSAMAQAFAAAGFGKEEEEEPAQAAPVEDAASEPEVEASTDATSTEETAKDDEQA
jgi:hypothetical protein